MRIIKDNELRSYIQSDLVDFISLSSAMAGISEKDVKRQMIGRFFLEASKCEEMLDAFGAQRNRYWSPVRIAVAVAKAFSQVIYNLFHLYFSADGYNLMKVEGNFKEATQESLFTLIKAFSNFSRSFMKIAESMELAGNLHSLEYYNFHEVTVNGKLQANLKRKTPGEPKEIALNLATSLLNTAEEGSWLDIYRKIEPEDYYTCIPDIISETKLRYLADNFHSLQSLYDTYLSNSDIAEEDKKLPVLRGQITVVYHLLDTAVTLVHFYERHALVNWDKKLDSPISNQKLLEIIIGYFVSFANKYLVETQKLCRDILKSYAVMGEITVPIPSYRGFHVRPSTLIAKIIIHYGSEVQMILGDSVYNAALPLELFRANEELNRRKRNAVASYIINNELIRENMGRQLDEEEMKDILRDVFLDLLENQKIMIYDSDFSFSDITPYETESLPEFIKRTIALYLAMGKIDIISNDTVKFRGDKRVLEDIKILAENGYGEDKFGNNIVLPKELSYLKR